MDPLRRSFLKLIGAAGGTLSLPALALADRIRILPDGPATPAGSGLPNPDLARALGGLGAGPVSTQGGLSVLWLQAREGAARPPLEVATLDEARASGALTVLERAQASVPDLIAENRGKSHVLLLAGEILVGGKQNRVLREDLLLPPLSGPRNVGVYCVEQGRWNEGRTDFESRSTVVQPSVRSHVLQGAGQSRVWSELANATHARQAPSPTGSYQAVYDKPEIRAQLDTATRGLEPKGGAATVGAAVFAGPNLTGIDAFHSAGLLAREWPKLLRAYALDAVGARAAGWDEAAARARVEGLLRGAARVDGSLRGNAGVGQLFEFGIDRHRGVALIWEGQALHVAIL